MPHKDPEIRKEYFRQYHIKNKAKKNAASKRHFEANREDYKARFKQYYLEHGHTPVADLPDERKERIRAYDRQRNRKKLADKYGLDVKDIPDTLACEVCAHTERVAFDHNHNTGVFRGFLCYRCNLALGYIRDDVTTLQNLIAYLHKNV